MRNKGELRANMTLHATRLHTNVRVTQVMKQLEQVEKELALARESVKCFSKKVVFFSK